MNCNQIAAALERVKSHIETEAFQGYDPYDALNAKIRFSLLGKWAPILAIQLHKRNPLNLRNILGIKKGYNPKGLGLLLLAYSLLYRFHPHPKIKEKMDFLFGWLHEHPSPGYHGYCWGYNFDWASREKYLAAYTPSLVVTAFVGKGIFAYYQATKDEKAAEVLQSIPEFILHDLPVTENDEGICFSYTPLLQDCCYNASMLGAEILMKVHSVTQEPKLKVLSQKAVDFTLAHQHPDGHWNYNLCLKSGKEKSQIDFHQGYILDSLAAFIKHGEIEDEKYLHALQRGAKYYRAAQFFSNGRSRWRVPKNWPVDIHNQAQGIITFSRSSWLDRDYLEFAHTIADWTIRHMQDQAGYFYYRKYRVAANKIPYLRWSQAWMFLALTYLLVKS